MTIAKNLIKIVELQDTLTKNEEKSSIFNTNAKCNEEIAMSYNKVTNQLEQEYYDKASGCSVKAQEDNLFDYKSWI